MTSIFIFSYQLTWQLVLFPAWFSWPPHCLSSLYQGVSVYHGAQHCDKSIKNIRSSLKIRNHHRVGILLDYFQVWLCCLRVSCKYIEQSRELFTELKKTLLLVICSQVKHRPSQTGQKLLIFSQSGHFSPGGRRNSVNRFWGRMTSTNSSIAELKFSS